MKYYSNYNYFLNFKENLSKDIDVIISENKYLGFTMFFQEQSCNITTFNETLLPQLRRYKDLEPTEVLTGLIREIDLKKHDPYQIIFHGLMVLYYEKHDKFYLVDISKALRRTPNDSNAEAQSIIGSRDGFTENFKDNISLIRSRLKNSNLLIEEFSIGRRSKTWVGLLYIDDIHDDGKRNEIIKILTSIDIDAVVSINDLLPYFSSHQILPVTNYTGLPDLATTRLLNGEFLLVIDRIPVVLSLPVSFNSLTEERIDYVNNRPLRLLQKGMVLLCFFLSTSFLGVFLSFLTFQVDALSLPLLSTLAVTQKGAIFPIVLEILFVLFLFELYHLVGFRSSEKTLSSTLVLIGGLIIGQNLIDSGLVGVLVITLTALSFLSGFVVSNNLHLSFGISILRLLYILAALFFGLLGISIVAVISTVHFSKQSFLGEHFFYPFIPFDFDGIKDYFKARSNQKRYLRRNVAATKDQTMKRVKR